MIRCLSFMYNCHYYKFFFLLLPFCFGKAAHAQPITIPVVTQNNAMILQANEHKELGIIYFGAKLGNVEEYAKIPAAYRQASDYSGILNSAYSASGAKGLNEPAISVNHSDGNLSLDLRYLSHKNTTIDDNVSLLSIQLKDPVYNFEVTLYYKSFYKENVIEQWSSIKHNEKGNVVLQKFASANLYLKGAGYWLKQYHGDWAKEMQPEEFKLSHGIKVLDSKLGTRANLFQPSIFMVSLDAPATEDTGKVLFGAMEYSGNFRIDLEMDQQDNLRVISGINNYASAYTLKPNEVFETPKFLYTYSTQGKGFASRNLQRWARNYQLMDGKGNRLTLLNNWEATYFDFDEQKLSGILSDTKKLGVDLFLLDDGWFANKYPRNSDHTGLGDWQENKKKLPNGISSLVKEAKGKDLKFGIWLEPEMVNPKSELYEKHPDWVIKQPQREEHYFRNQLVLDLANPKVQDFVFHVVDDMLTKNPELAYIKWDCNAVIYNAYSSYLKDQNHFYIEYMRGLYRVLEKIRAKYPVVPMMLCSGGGGRVDYAALKYFTEFWPSDNTDPLERIFIQWQYSYFYPAISSSNHVTDWGKQPLKFRTDVAMMGKLGFDIVVDKLNPSDLSFCQNAIKLYGTLKPVIWHGEQYRLTDPTLNDVASMMYLSNDQSHGVVFNYLVNNRYDAGNKVPVLLKGLDPVANYKVAEVNLYPGKQPKQEAAVYSGDFLMKVGFNPMVDTERTSVILQIERQ